MRTREIIVGDAAEIMEYVGDGTVDLVYLDPPFFTQKDWGEFDDRWVDMCAFVESMRTIARQVFRVLRPGGALYWQGDDWAIHRVWCMLEDVFGTRARRSIAWSGHNASGMKTRTANWVREHDTILYFLKPGGEPVFHRQFEPYSETTLGVFKYVDPGTGRRYRRRPDNGERGDPYVPDPDHPGQVRQYLDEFEGAPVGSVWRDFLASTAGERSGYPTQKPLALTDRIIRASTNEGDLVLDPCCGSGTCLVSAERLGRRWVGIDRNPEAVGIAAMRTMREVASVGLIDTGPKVNVLNRQTVR